MCIPHGATGSKSNGYIKESKPRKKIQRLPKEIFEHGDPNYDGGIIEYIKPEPKKNFFEKFLGI